MICWIGLACCHKLYRDLLKLWKIGLASLLSTILVNVFIRGPLPRAEFCWLFGLHMCACTLVSAEIAVLCLHLALACCLFLVMAFQFRALNVFLVCMLDWKCCVHVWLYKSVLYLFGMHVVASCYCLVLCFISVLFSFTCKCYPQQLRPAFADVDYW